MAVQILYRTVQINLPNFHHHSFGNSEGADQIGILFDMYTECA